MNLEASGALDGFTRIVLASDGGPGHFKVYKTQHWMSKWASDLAKRNAHIEWNMFFANLGHNICDSHAGHMKRYYFHPLIFFYLLLDKFEVPRRISSTCTRSRMFCRAWKYWGTLTQLSSLLLTSTLATKTSWNRLAMGLSRSIITSPMAESACWSVAISKERAIMWYIGRNKWMVRQFAVVFWVVYVKF